MPDILKKKEAIAFLGLDEKVFENYFRVAEEFGHLPRVGHQLFKFDKNTLQAWKDDHVSRTVALDQKDYASCLDFALAMHFRGYVASDFGTGRQREFGQKITNWVKGQLGEVAVQKFFKARFGVEVELDFDIRKKIVPQDIIGVREGGVIRPPKIGVSIKSSKPKSAFLVLGQNEIEIEGRKSDVHIFCRPDIPDDHLLRLAKSEVVKAVKDMQHYSRYEKSIPGPADIPCEVAGWCYADDLRKVSEIPGQKFDGFRWVRESGLLRRSEKDWKELLGKL